MFQTSPRRTAVATAALHWQSETALSLNWTWFHEEGRGNFQQHWSVPHDLGLNAAVFVTLKAPLAGTLERFQGGSYRLRLWRAETHLPSVSVHLRLQSSGSPSRQNKAIPSQFMECLSAAAPRAASNQISARIAGVYRDSSEEEPFLDIVLPEEDVESTLGTSTLPPDLPALQIFHGRKTVVEVHLPYLSALEWKRRVRRLADAAIRITPDGALIVTRSGANPNNHLVESFLATALLRRKRPVGGRVNLHFIDKRIADARLTALMLERTLLSLGKWNLAPWLASIKELDGQVEADIGITLPAETACGWMNLRGRGLTAFFRSFRPLAVAVQQALRCWIPYMWFCSDDRFHSLDNTIGMVTFAASPPFRNRRQRGDYTYDVLDPKKVHMVLSRTSPKLPPIFKVLHGWLSSRTHPARRLYSPNALKPVLRSHVIPLRRLALILSTETRIVDSLIRLVTLTDSVHAGDEPDLSVAALHLHRQSRLIVDSFRKHLRRLDGVNLTFESLQAMAVFFATAAMAAEAPPRIRPRLVARFRHLTSGVEYILTV